ncbi:MAG: asparagine synthetase B, partial [candidate division Zixibacteria bacterium]|nr:asparagine synthetase B [candidate division Zixibacteria bacterium]
MKRLLTILILIAVPVSATATSLLIPMDDAQVNHLKAYGVVYKALDADRKAEWLLNYRGGSFLLDNTREIIDDCLLKGVTHNLVSSGEIADIYRIIEVENMERVELEKAPAIAVYSPPSSQPWDDAVTLALTYAEIEYDLIWDEEVLAGTLEEYDWLHSHHEDYSGQYGKFYAAFRTQLWYRADVKNNEEMAQRLGYNKVSEMKRDVALTIYDYVRRGGFFFSMCSAPETIDIALAAAGVDIVPQECDGDPVDPGAQQKLDFSNTFAFENFKLVFDPFLYRHSDIDTYPDRLVRFTEANDVFYLFDFAAKLDPVPSMLVQNHVGVVNGFMGQNTG